VAWLEIDSGFRVADRCQRNLPASMKRQSLFAVFALGIAR